MIKKLQLFLNEFSKLLNGKPVFWNIVLQRYVVKPVQSFEWILDKKFKSSKGQTDIEELFNQDKIIELIFKISKWKYN